VGLSLTAAVVVLPLTACGLTNVSVTSAPESQAPSSTATLAFTPRLGDQNVVPGSPIVVTANDGRLTSVKITTPDGKALKGNLAADAQKWESVTQSLGYGTTYDVTVKAVDRNGLPTAAHQTFTTLVPKDTVGVSSVDPQAGTTFGVGIPIVVRFDQSIENKAEVEKRLEVVTPKPIKGAWRWLSDSQVQFRPRDYWPANIPITVHARLTGVQVAPQVWGEKDATFKFHTTNSIVGRVDMKKHTLTVAKNGKVIKVIPITTGKPGFDTRSGTKVVMTKERNRIMDASTGGTSQGDPEYYRLNVEYAMRLTWSGEFLHAAPWSEGSQGYENVSHGCTGMSTENAAWLYNISNIGDVYVYTGNDRMMTDDDNGITVWNNRWSDFLKDSKSGEITTTGAVAPKA